MNGGKWLAYEQAEREGRINQAEAIGRGGDPPEASEPARYPILWRLSVESLMELAGAGNRTVAEMVEVAAHR